MLSSPPLPKKWPERLAQRWPLGKRIFAANTAVDGSVPGPGDTAPASNGMCTAANAGDQGVLAAQALCASQLVFPCPSAPDASYPRPAAQFPLPPVPPNLPSMPDPCVGVPANPWCPR